MIDNIITGIFEKIFDNLTNSGSDLLEEPIDSICKLTFSNKQVYDKIHDLCRKPLDRIIEVTDSMEFRRRFFFKKLKHRINVEILLNNWDQIKSLLNRGYRLNSSSLKICVINNRLNIFKNLITDPKYKLEGDLLMYAAKFGYEEFYFYLRLKNLQPNLSVFRQAVGSGSLSIIKDIGTRIAIYADLLKPAFDNNNTAVVTYLLDLAIKDGVAIRNDLAHYPILNGNQQLLKILDQKINIEWTDKLYYSALLSGSMDMILYIESKIPDIHEDKHLDKAKSRKSNLLTSDVSYQDESGRTYFSHVMNYAIQSQSLTVVKYVLEKGYGISISNFITCIKQGTVQILEYVCEHCALYKITRLPIHILFYLGPRSYVTDKLTKAKILFDHDLIELNDKLLDMSMDDHRKHSLHLNMIEQEKEISVDNVMDTDYVMSYYKYFPAIHQSKSNYLSMTVIKLALELKIESNCIYDLINNQSNKQLVVDTLLLMGDYSDLINYYPIASGASPSKQIVFELMSYGLSDKINFLIDKGLLSESTIKPLSMLYTMLGDTEIRCKDLGLNPDLKSVLLSCRTDLIEKWLNQNPNELITIPNAKILLNTGDLNIIKKFSISHLNKSELINYATDNDLLDLIGYIKDHCKDP